MAWRVLIIGTLLVSSAISGSVIVPKVYFFKSSLQQELAELRAENEALRADVPDRQVSQKHLSAKIYSSYPFNNRHEIVLAAGVHDGVAVGMPVTVGGNVLLGQIKEVFENHSVVRTIFDQDWKLAVRIGDGRAESLLVGGQDPKLSLLDKQKSLPVLASVYVAAPGFPYGLLVGKVESIKDSQSGVWREAGLSIPYNLTDLREVVVLTDYQANVRQ
jgi:cell shape-determining protein MreC